VLHVLVVHAFLSLSSSYRSRALSKLVFHGQEQSAPLRGHVKTPP